MQSYGSLFHMPWWFASIMAFALASLILMGYILYSHQQKISDATTVMKALKPFSQAYSMTVLRGDDINAKNILNGDLAVDIILQINRVSSMKELLQKNEIIACSNR
jgi:hypothetical protein